MPAKFVSCVFFEGYVIAMTEDGDMWRFEPHDQRWSLLARGPFMVRNEAR